jgi:cell shape-determining protein MreC
MLFAWGMLIGVVFLFLVPREAAGRLQYVYASVFRWPLAAGRGLTQAAKTTVQERTISPREYEEQVKACTQLRNACANLQAQVRETNQRLERLTKLSLKPGLERMQAIPAQIITLNAGELTIDQGKTSGVAAGQCVLSLTDSRLDDQCVIGVISAVYENGAKVRLMTDPKCSLAVTIGKLNVPKVMKGAGDGTARIPLLRYPDYEVKVGDIVYAAGTKGFLGAPVIVAEITHCRRDPASPEVWDITARPVCDCAELTEVVVMKPASVP